MREAVKRLKVAKLKIERAREDEEYTRFQLEQLDELNPLPGEQAELEREREVMTNMTVIKNALSKACGASRPTGRALSPWWRPLPMPVRSLRMSSTLTIT